MITVDADVILAIMFVCCLMKIRQQFCVLMLVMFLATSLIGANANQFAYYWGPHAAMILLYMPCAFFGPSVFRMTVAGYMVFQFFMCLDAFAYQELGNSWTKFFYIVYPYLAFILNVLIMWSMFKGVKDGYFRDSSSSEPNWSHNTNRLVGSEYVKKRLAGVQKRC